MLIKAVRWFSGSAIQCKGHSKWDNIKAGKAAIDAAKSRVSQSMEGMERLIGVSGNGHFFESNERSDNERGKQLCKVCIYNIRLFAGEV
jgi:hypothetical protein